MRESHQLLQEHLFERAPILGRCPTGIAAPLSVAGGRGDDHAPDYVIEMSIDVTRV